jgi:predicted DNA-binding ribbon-helix-helix protein
MRFGQEFTENFHRWMSVLQDVTQNLIYSIIMRMMIVWPYCIIWRRLMKRTQIMLEDDKKQILKRIAKQDNKSFSALVREMLDEQIKEHQNSQLKYAAQALLMDYKTDEDLLSFASLDGEDFQA